MLKRKKFKIETLQSILRLVTENCQMAISDLLDAYLTVLIHPSHHVFHKFVFLGKMFMFKVLPFRYTGTPHMFTKLLKPLMALLHSLGVTVTFYLDDSWQAAVPYKDYILDTYNSTNPCMWIPTKYDKISTYPTRENYCSWYCG